MYLKSLKISGFKSFASKSYLEFPSGITAVVGPNGSGKSNLVESLRWVMGEQSMKGLRAKKSEELIFAGSKDGKVSRQNKAEVEIVLDNKDRAFPLDFDEVTIARKVFRDGESQYLLNNSQVRLRDITEFLARARVGVSGYSVISQGMADALLNASPSERKDMVDEALGLKEFQMKKKESIDKLKQTRNNIINVDGIVAELTPHIRFLKRQVSKIEQRNILEHHLKDIVMFYCAKEQDALKSFDQNFENEKANIAHQVESIRHELANIEEELKREIDFGESKIAEEIDEQQEALNGWQDKKMGFMRELANIDAQLKIEPAKNVTDKDYSVNIAYIGASLKTIYEDMKGALALEGVGEIRAKIQSALERFDGLFAEIQAGKRKPAEAPSHARENENLLRLNEAKEEMSRLMREADDRINEIREAIRARQRDFIEDRKKVFQLKDNQHEMKLAVAKLQDEMALIGEKERSIKFRRQLFSEQFEYLNEEEKRLVREEKVFERLSIQERRTHLEVFDAEGLRREIEKLKARLEVAQDVDPDIEKEYKETQERYEFLVNQLEDLKKSSQSLYEVIKDLDARIDESFKDGFKVINEEFNKFFKMLFGGGRATLVRKVQLSMKMKVREEEGDGEDGEDAGPDEELENEEDKFQEEKIGIEINVDLPGKKIQAVESLSGGERSLTSIALLFAFVAHASPPFLVVDEIDAALDETNSYRFAQILNELGKKTQFVVITHNRETMRYSDVLYGLTMDKNGISNILSLKFEEATEIA